jgi:hypothetical protein
MVLANTKFHGPSCVGEIKGEDHINDNYMSIVDIIRIGLISKASIDGNYNKGILGAHVVGKFL